MTEEQLSLLLQYINTKVLMTSVKTTAAYDKLTDELIAIIKKLEDSCKGRK